MENHVQHHHWPLPGDSIWSGFSIKCDPEYDIKCYRTFFICHLDNILIYSPDPNSHIKHMHLVLQRLLQHQFYVKADKCKFHNKNKENISFLGYNINTLGVSMDQKKVNALLDWPTPQTVKVLEIPEKKKLLWNPVAEMAFQKI